MAEHTHPLLSQKPAKPASSEKAVKDKFYASWIIPAAAAVGMIGAFCIYYFVYVSAQREYLTNRNFRALAVLGDQLQTMISIRGSTLEYYADQLDTSRHSSGEQRTKVKLDNFLVVRPEDKDLPKSQQVEEAQKDYLKYLVPGLELLPVQSSAAAQAKTGEQGQRLEVQRRGNRWELLLTARHVEVDKYYYTERLDLDTLLKPLVGSLGFDEILLVSEEGNVVYQDKKAGPQFTTLTSLLQTRTGVVEPKSASSTTEGQRAAVKNEARIDHEGSVKPNADPAWRTTSNNPTEVVLAGSRYKLFLQPVLLDTFNDGPKQDTAAQEWVLCGLKSSSTLEWQALSISYIFIIWFTALFFAISMAGPVLKIVFLNNRERLRLRELGFLGLFLVLLTSVLTLSAFQAAAFSANDATDSELEQLAATLSNNIHNELKEMLGQLVDWCKSSQLRDDLDAAGAKEVVRNANQPLYKDAIKPTPEARTYPFINNAFWTDDDGHQIVKWSTSGYLTPMIDISQLPIYSHARSMYLDGSGPAFHVDSVLPPNKLDYVAAITTSTEDCNSTLPETIRGDVRGGSAFLTSQPLSLIEPILPLGYGFALIDRSGMVLFHSDKTKNLRENFHLESDRSRQLYAAIYGHAMKRSLPIKYLGADYMARVVPIPGISQSPWSLVVYRDVTSVRTTNLQVMTMATTLLLMLLAGPVLVVAISTASRRPLFAPEWVWPNPGRMSTYLYQLGLYTSLIILFLLLGFSGSGEQTVVACLAVIYMALILTWWCLRVFPSSKAEAGHNNWLAPAVCSALALICFSLVLIIQWSRLNSLIYLLVFFLITVFSLLNGPRHRLINRLNHWVPSGANTADGANNPTNGLLTYRTCYGLTVLLLLFLIGVLMPIALFRSSLNIERRLGRKQAQLHVASALSQRLLLIGQQCEDHEMGGAACEKLANEDREAWSRIVLDPLVDTSSRLPIEPHQDPGKNDELYSPWFQALIYALHHDYNEDAAEMLGVIGDRTAEKASSASSEWYWTNEGPDVQLRLHGVHPLRPDDHQNGDKEKDLLIKSPAPRPSPADTVAGITVASGVMLSMGILCWALARKLFLFDVTPMKMTGDRQVAESLHEGRNVVVLLPPVSDWQVDAPKWTMDLTEMATKPAWAEDLDLNAVPVNTIIEIRHFEHSSNNAEIDNQKFILLDRLMARENAQLAVILTVPASSKDYRRMFPAFDVIDLREEPFYWLKQYEGPAQHLIWKECGPLAALWPLGAQLAKDIKHEATQSEDAIASEILERAEPYYRMIWKECSKEQKFVLAQFAEDGLMNPTSRRAISHLVRRGLIVRDPEFRIMNESFRRFLVSAPTAEQKEEWLRESHRSGWGKVHGTFFTTMILLGAFLLTTQNALWQSAAAYVTTALGALGTLGKLFNTFRSAGPAAEKPN